MLSRRGFLASLLVAPNSADMRVEEVSTSEESYLYRTPLKFGGRLLDRVTLLNVRLRARLRSGREATGFGSMPLGNVWAFPSKTLGYQQTLDLMRAHAARVRSITADCHDYGHPIELASLLEPAWLKAASEIASSEPIPKLAALVDASPFDAALHDAYGKLHGRSVYQCYSREFLAGDLSRYLGDEFRGQHLGSFVSPTPKPRMPLYHLVGALDPITRADIVKPIGDGLPETLPEWIVHNGLTHLKIKLNGDNLAWDCDRILAVDRVADSAVAYSLDFNEKCPNVEYLLAVLRQTRERSPRAFARIQYVEQPTSRDLAGHRSNVMHAAAKLRPVVIDESLTDLENLRLAREMGYTGAALKACKGQTQALLMAAAAQHWRMFLCVQDLTCPGASLIHSAGLAAHVPTAAAIEANARQYCPAANRDWEARFPGLFQVRDGSLRTGEITGPGLGAVAE
jgi:L-alanine-DL-glutamate epimerase-like enolase superfamily enzyme